MCVDCPCGNDELFACNNLYEEFSRLHHGDTVCDDGDRSKWDETHFGVDPNNHLGMHTIHDVRITRFADGLDETILHTDIGLLRCTDASGAEWIDTVRYP